MISKTPVLCAAAALLLIALGAPRTASAQNVPPAKPPKSPDAETEEPAGKADVDAAGGAAKDGKNAKDAKPEPAKPLTAAQRKSILRDLASRRWARREAATMRLIKLEDQAEAILQAGIHDPDPEVRLRCHYILRRPFLLTERYLDVMVEEPGSSEAVEAFDKLTSGGAVFRRALFLKAREFASNQNSERQVQRLVACLDSLREMATESDIPELVKLLELDLRGAEGINSPLPLVVETLAGLPREPVVKALLDFAARSRKAATPWQRPQSISVLGELATGDQALAIVTEGLEGDLPTRRAALVAFREWNLPADKLLPLTRLLRGDDKDDPEVGLDDSLVIATLEVLGLAKVKGAVERIIEVVGYDSEIIALAAIQALGNIGDPRAVKPLRDRLWPTLIGTPTEKKDKLKEMAAVRGMAAWALARLGQVSAAELIALLGANEGLSFRVCQALAREGSKASVSHLKLRAQTGSGPGPAGAVLRRHAVTALGHVKGDPSVAELLAGVARDNKAPADVAVAALTSLRDLDTPVSRQQLVALIDIPRTALQRYVFEFLGELGVREAVPRLIKKLRGTGNGSAARGALVQTLGQLGGKDAITELNRLYKREGQVAERRQLAWALARAGDRSKMPAAVKFGKQQLEQSNGTNGLNSLGIDYLYAHDWDGARLTFRRMMWSDPAAQFATYNLACVEGLKGRVDEAWRLLSRSIRENPQYWIGNWRHVQSDPDLASLRKDPRYLKMVERLRLQSELGIHAGG